MRGVNVIHENRAIRDRFVEMRVQGFSYMAMSAELEVSQRALRNWNNEFADEIAAERARIAAAVHRKYAMMKEEEVRGMAKGLESRSKFVEMRAAGLSYRTIADRLGLSRATLVSWNREFADEIATVRAREVEELHAKYLMMKEHRLQIFGEQLERMRDELRKRDLGEVSTAELLRLFLRCYRALSMEAEPRRAHVAVGVEASMKNWEEIMERVIVATEEDVDGGTGWASGRASKTAIPFGDGTF